MRRDGRLSAVLHLLLHLSQETEPVTSESLAKATRTNPVVVRRILAGLRDEGLVRSDKGHGGGWVLACDLAKVTLRDVYAALGSPPLIALGHRADEPGCLVEAAVNAALGESFAAVEALFLSRLGEVTLARLSAEVHQRASTRGGSHRMGKVHAT